MWNHSSATSTSDTWRPSQTLLNSATGHAKQNGNRYKVGLKQGAQRISKSNVVTKVIVLQNADSHKCCMLSRNKGKVHEKS